MITQEQINELWTVRSDNYNDYVADELTTERPAEWLTLIHANAPSLYPCGGFSFSAAGSHTS